MCAPLLAQDRLAPVPAALRADASAAKRAADSGDLAEAERVYRKLLEQAPDNVYLLSNLGVIYFREAQYYLAKQHCQKAIAINPADGFSHCALGIVLYTEGKYAEATQSLNRALELDANNVTAHNYLGITQSQLGHGGKAREELLAAVTLDPKYADAAFNLSVVLATTKPVDLAQARTYYRIAVSLGAERDRDMEAIVGGDGGLVDALAGGGKESPQPAVQSDPAKVRAKEAFESGNYAEAEKIYRRLLEAEPRSLYILSNLGVVLFRANKLEEAEKTLKQAIAVDAGDAFSHTTLGIVYYSRGKFDDAVNELTKSLEINPSNATALNYLGIAAEEKGWHEAAQQALEKARQLDPSLKEKTPPPK
jgi:Flp pilus assembly protein TadD